MNSPNQLKQPTKDPKGQVDETLNFLQQLELFRGTSLDILKLYAYLSKKEEYEPGEPIVLQGKPAKSMYLIISGSVSIYEKHGGINYKLQELTPDTLNYFGELALLSKFNWFFSAWADSKTTILSISREAFQKIMERFPEAFPVAIEKIISLRINRLIAQTHGFIEKTDPDSWETCPYTVKK